MHLDKLEKKTVSHEEEIHGFILYNWTLDNFVTSSEITYRFLSIDKRYQENHEYTSKIVILFYASIFSTVRRNTHVE